MWEIIAATFGVCAVSRKYDRTRFFRLTALPT